MSACTHRVARYLLIASMSALLCANSVRSAPTLEDYARGMRIETVAAQPLVEIVVPDDVYRGITRADLGDVRVFNAEGSPVPHAVCANPQNTPATVSELSLPVFQLREMPRTDGGSRIEVQTAGGTQVKVQQDAGGMTDSIPSVHIIDARETSDMLRAVQFEWSTPDNASEVKISVQSSEDLDRWTTVVPASTLLEVTQDGLQLRRQRIELPQRVYMYLRIARVDGGPALQIKAVMAERISLGQQIEPQWFTATRDASDPNMLLFDAARTAPIGFARLRLADENSAARIVLESRSDAQGEWRERWRGETYLVVTEGERRYSPAAHFDVTTDRYWRVQLPADTQLQSQPMLELGYRPVRLRFITQGSAPYTLAFGSRRAELSVAQPCEGLLADVGSEDRAQMIAAGYPGALRSLGGDAALTPLPRKTPLRQMVLWGVLIAGAAALIAMALSLLKRVRPTG